MKIELRRIQPKDIDELAMLIVHTWKFDEFLKNDKAILHFGKMYLMQCLINQTYQELAIVDGKVAGIILGADQRKKKFHVISYMKYLWYAFRLHPVQSVYKKEPILHTYHKIMKEMRDSLDSHQDAEVSLFIMKKDYQGLGLGKILFENLENHFKEKQVTAYYVHTDTACNYKFYIKRGMQILSQHSTTIAYADTKNVTMFILGKTML